LKQKPRTSSVGSVDRSTSALARLHVAYSRDEASGVERQAQDRPRILVVEDDFLIAMEAEMALTQAGFAVVTASSAEEALSMGALHHPALAVMDIRLLGARDGVDAALDLLREHGIRSIFATAHRDPDISRRAQPASPLAWLQKPYTTKSLIEAIEKALRELKPVQ
jgi:two-component system, response regulator PdtaR